MLRRHACSHACLAFLFAACSATHPASDDGGAPGSDAGGPTPFVGAYMMRECAPDDGLAYRLILYQAAVPECSADPSRASLAFYIFDGSDIIFPLTSGSVVTSSSAGGGLGNGSATWCPGGTPPCQTTNDFTLRFDTYEDLASATGVYTVDLPSGSRTGTFSATWCEGFGPPLCG